MSTVKDWNFQYQFPTNSNFLNRITAVEFKESKSSGNPMVQIDCEVISPDEVDVGGELINIAGVATKSYYTTMVPGNPEKSEKAKERWTSDNEEHPGLIRIIFSDEPEYAQEMCDKFNPENPDPEMLKKMVGRCVLTAMSSQKNERRASPTSAQIQAAKGTGKPAQGDVMKNPRTGKPLISWQPQINEIFALAPKEAAAGKPF